MSNRMRIYSCPECGNSYEAYPPDDVHTKSSIKDPKGNASSVVKIIHDCPECNTPITIYWYRSKPAVAIL